MVVEALLISTLLRHLWERGAPPAEVLHATVDNSGYDVVIECNSVQRHIQFKTSTKSKSRMDVNERLALKESGCVVWMIVDPETLAFEKFYWLGGKPGEVIPVLSGFPRAKHPRRNKQGERPVRETTRAVPRTAFSDLSKSIGTLAECLFGRMLPPLPPDENA